MRSGEQSFMRLLGKFVAGRRFSWNVFENSLKTHFYQNSKLWKSYLSLWVSSWFWKIQILFPDKPWLEGWAVPTTRSFIWLISYFQSDFLRMLIAYHLTWIWFFSIFFTSFQTFWQVLFTFVGIAQVKRPITKPQ